MLRLLEHREQCVKCNKLGIAICRDCGVLCSAHERTHRHEFGHIPESINWQQFNQPEIPERQISTFCNKHLKDTDQHDAIELLEDEPSDYLNNRRTD